MRLGDLRAIARRQGGLLGDRRREQKSRALGSPGSSSGRTGPPRGRHGPAPVRARRVRRHVRHPRCRRRRGLGAPGDGGRLARQSDAGRGRPRCRLDLRHRRQLALPQRERRRRPERQQVGRREQRHRLLDRRRVDVGASHSAILRNRIPDNVVDSPSRPDGIRGFPSPATGKVVDVRIDGNRITLRPGPANPWGRPLQQSSRRTVTGSITRNVIETTACNGINWGTIHYWSRATRNARRWPTTRTSSQD